MDLNILAKILNGLDKKVRLVNKMYRDAYDINKTSMTLTTEGERKWFINFPIASRHALKYTTLFAVSRHNDLCVYLPQFTNLIHLRLLDSHLSYSDCNNLAIGLPNLTKLKTLRIDKSEFGNKGIILLCPGIKKLKCLEFVSLEGIYMKGEEGAAHLGPALQELPNLKNLNLHENIIGVEGLQLLSNCFKNLETLNISNMIGDIWKYIKIHS